MKDYFPIAVIIIKLEAMVNKILQNRSFLKEIEFRIKIAHIPM